LWFEGLASSEIEGIRVTGRRLLEARAGTADDRTATWVLDNIEAIETASEQSDEDITTRMLERWQRTLMKRSPLPSEHIGRFRSVQAWIGGPSPLSAVFVPAPPEYIDGLMDDLIAYANRRGVPPIAQAAILHAQFETIHPFADGNGRIGRTLIGWLLRRRFVAYEVIPPLSPQIARRVDQYVYGLWAYRNGRMDEWVTWFAEVALAAADATRRVGDAVRGLVESWELEFVEHRSDDAARRLIAHLPAMPIVDVATATSAIEVSDRSVRRALLLLERHGILEPLPSSPAGPGRPRKRWIAGALADLL